MKECWEKFEKLHGILVSSGQVVEKIILFPDDFTALENEFFPRSLREFWSPGTAPHLTGAVTHYGPVEISQDPLGVRLAWIA
jgi:hypothetical protein